MRFSLAELLGNLLFGWNRKTTLQVVTGMNRQTTTTLTGQRGFHFLVGWGCCRRHTDAPNRPGREEHPEQKFNPQWAVLVLVLMPARGRKLGAQPD